MIIFDELYATKIHVKSRSMNELRTFTEQNSKVVEIQMTTENPGNSLLHLKNAHRIASSVSIEVTLLPRMTCKGEQGSIHMHDVGRLARDTHHGADWVLLGGGRLLQRVVKDEVQKQVISTQCAADLAAALEVNEQFLVHELRIDEC